MLPASLTLPKLLRQQADRVQQQLELALSRPLFFDEQDRAALALSDFVSDSLIIYPQWWLELHQQPPIFDEYRHYQTWLEVALHSVSDEESLMRALRLFRRRMLVRISWGQSLRLYTTEDTLRLLSVLAEVLIIAARNWIYQTACHDWGTPTNQHGEAQPLLILGMGKLGGIELNYSSDIDLIFIYPENGVTQGGRKELENVQFFTRVGQRLIKVLDKITVDGFVYRVDMRLRPFGDSGPLVLSFSALEEYYQEQGRDWERYAMVKARVMGDSHQGYDKILHQMLRPFIFRRYIDFSVIQSLRNMKGMIASEVHRRGLIDNIKLGAGGIREIEFITQVFQLIRGGREPSLQGRSLLPTLEAIAGLELLEQSSVRSLQNSYLFLRHLENLLQAIDDRQTQTLPEGELDRARLAWGMGFSDWPMLHSALEKKMRDVHIIFDQLIGESEVEEDTQKIVSDYSNLWFDGLNESELVASVANLSVETAGNLLKTIADFRHDLEKRPIGLRGREVLDQLMPRLLAEVCLRDDKVRLLPRLTHLLLSIISRTTYLELLLEYRSALTQLIRLCAASPMVADKLARYPILLDELLDPRLLYQPTPLESYKDELRQYLLRVAEEDEEQRLEALRQFKQVQILRIAAADISGALPIMQVSDHLTYLAEAIIDAVVQQAWRHMVNRYGQPTHLDGRDGRGFAIIAYGKLGGWELGYGSDLDLVFLIDCPEEVMTDGERSISGSQFYVRLTQRIIHLFSTKMASGVLYEVDARLRPSGASGLLVSTINAFDDYQRNDAWTWEHQALVRARMVYHDVILHQRFRDIRHEILCRPRVETALRQEVCEMRKKMHASHPLMSRDQFDLKHDSGGIIDIEFIAQYLVLRYAHQQPNLTHWSDNVRIFELMVEYEIISRSDGAALTQAYISMRDESHRLALQGDESRVLALHFSSRRALVIECWQKWLDCGS